MRKSFTFLFVLFTFIFCGFSLAQDNARETEVGDEAIFTLTNPTGWVYDSPEAVLFDNGPYFNSPGGGPGGADGSVLQTSLLMSTLGAGHALSALIRVADDFVIPSGQNWTINTISFYAYQTGSTTTSTMTSVNVRIWNGPPGAVGSTIVFGDTTTNRMASTSFTNCYRYSESAVGTTRPIMKQIVNIGTSLPAGTYWVDWQTGGSLASGPWAPPIAILGQTTTGNAQQSISGVWANLTDGGTLTGMGLPFIIDGSNVNPNTFFDNFDSYTAGQQLTGQTTAWRTWSGTPGTGEDPFVSTAFAYSSPNSIRIIANNDVVRLHGSKTAGKWYMSFLFYIPATKTGYFNTMNGFAPNPNVWGMDAFFDAGGAGRIDTTGGGGNPATTVNFTWAVAQWNQVIVIVNLDTKLAEFWIGTNPLNLTQVATWDWTRNGTKVNRLDCNNIYGAAATDEMYVDNYFFSDEMPVVVPVELTSFTATTINGNVTLNWSTATELNNSGFQIERSNGSEYQVVGFVAGYGTTTEVKNYSFNDQNVNAGTYSYRLKQIDFDGTFEYSNAIEVDVFGVKEFTLGQNYPNPFNPATTINFSLAEPSFVKLAVFNLLGEEVQVLKNEYMNAGSFNVSFNASSLPSGMYLYKIETAQFSSVRKMMLMK